MDRPQAQWGRIGGLTAWALNTPETMVGAAHRGFAAKFERLVLDAAAANGEALRPSEVAARADRLRRAHMLDLAARSAQARKKKAGPVIETPGPAQGGRQPHGEFPDSA